MSLKTNKLRHEDPTKLLLARAASRQGLVLDNHMIQKVAGTLVMESMKVERLVGISEYQAEEIERLEEFADIILNTLPEDKREEVEAAARSFVWPAPEADETETDETETDADE